MAYADLTVIGVVGFSEYVEKGSEPFTKLSVGVKQGENHTEWYKVLVFGSRAKKAYETYQKGRMVFARGTPRVKAYLNKEGQPGYEVAILADTVRLTDKKQDA
jgi:single-stranded DNA-binding protein